jgi:methylated-DNA-[protein]-cysteine S-methyltransferase
MNVHFSQTVIGRIGIGEENGSITTLLFPTETVPLGAVSNETPLLKEAFRQLHAWLGGTTTEFSLPLAPQGTPFMERIWQELCRIPYGTTASYGEIAAAAGSPKAARAVGMACNRNPIPIIIPCHRVIGASGSLVGYVGGLEIKELLLTLEKTGRLPVNHG